MHLKAFYRSLFAKLFTSYSSSPCGVYTLELQLVGQRDFKRLHTSVVNVQTLVVSKTKRLGNRLTAIQVMHTPH